MSRHLIAPLLLGLTTALYAQTSATWPNYNAPNWFHVVSEAGTNTCAVAAVSYTFNQCARECDLISPGSSCLLRLHYSTTQSPHVDPASADVKVMYYVHGVPVSGWVAQPFWFTLAIDNPGLTNIQDGVHDISIDVQSVTQERKDFHYTPMLLHLHRGGSFITSALVPLLAEDYMYSEFQDTEHGGSVDMGPRVVYVDPSTRNMKGHPIADTTVTPWHTYTPSADLYQVEMAPHTNLFIGAQMWWQFPSSDPDAGKVYARAMVPKYDEDHPGLRPIWHHDRFPYRDGPRGVAWTSAYVTGQVGADGTFYFVEAGGPLREMHPDGSVETLVGWRVKTDKDPIFVDQPLGVVWQNEDLLGDFVEGQWSNRSGFRTPLDVAIDPKNAEVFYVAAYEDNCIWKVEEGLGANGQARVSVFAGDVAHVAGYADGVGHAARFSGPTSVVFDPICDCLYVADQNNDTIRKITRAGVVSTFDGTPGTASRVAASCACDPGQPGYTAPVRNRSYARYTVSASDAAAGMRPDIFQPMTVRVDSFGSVLVSDNGFGSIRRIHPTSHVTTQFANLQAGHWNNGNERGWTWFDVDRWGNAGELNSVYSCVFQGSQPDGETSSHPNEFYGYVSPNSGAGGLTHYIFNDWGPNPDGWGTRDHTDPPHYCWNVAVDPRGGLFMAGGGEHGQTYLRARKSTDIIASDLSAYYRGKVLWKSGGDAQFGSVYGPSFMLKFGSEAHNYLGFADAWDVTNAMTDAQLMSMFEVPNSWSGTDLNAVLNFIRLNAGLGPTSNLPPIDATPPIITPNVPSFGIVGMPLSVAAMATDDVAVVSGTVTLPGGSPTVISYPYSSTWTPTAVGSAQVTFTARDAVGHVTTSTSSIDVTSTTLPLMAVSVVTSCRVTVTDQNGPPDATGGWVVQFKRGTNTNVGNKVTSPPWSSSATLSPGTYTFFAIWTKSGETPVTRPAVPGVCK